jgi:uncharacterized membrane protein (UPF0127 family)
MLLVAGCGGSGADAGSSDRAGSPEPGAEASPSAPGSRPPGGQGPLPTVSATLDGVELELEVADDEQERATGLMRRTSVPPGTGMVFRFGKPVEARFYMYDVPIPLRAVFLRDGRVVSTVVMPPCEQEVPKECPTYGADGPFDTVVETAPETLPDLQPGDVYEERG